MDGWMDGWVVHLSGVLKLWFPGGEDEVESLDGSLIEVGGLALQHLHHHDAQAPYVHLEAVLLAGGGGGGDGEGGVWVGCLRCGVVGVWSG